MKIKYQAHVSDLGWLDPVEDGKIAGTVGQNRALEAFNINNIDIQGLGVHAFAYVQDYGWLDGKTIGQDVGTTGEGRHIEAIKIGLIGDQAENYDIWYRCHVQDYGWMNWAHNGEECGTIGGNRQVEAIQIDIYPRSENYNPTVQTFDRYLDLTPQNPPVPSAPDILDVARNYIGYITGTSADSVFGRRIAGVNAGDWCCYAVVCWAIDAGLNIPITGYCPAMKKWAESTGRWTGNPQPGYFVLFDFGGGENDEPNGTPDHIGLVEEVITSDHIISIEGNTGDPIGVYRRDRDYGILGYINPF